MENAGGQRADWRIDVGLETESVKMARGMIESWRAKRRQKKGDKAGYWRAARKGAENRLGNQDKVGRQKEGWRSERRREGRKNVVGQSEG